jgi:hypothetical protein
MIFCNHHELLRVRPCGVFCFRITSVFMKQFRRSAGMLGRVNGDCVVDILKYFTHSRPIVTLKGM